MRVLVLGGTGGIGPLLIEELLLAEHSLIIYARSPQKISQAVLSNPHVAVIKGELTDRDALASAFSESENRHDASERHAAVLVPFCNVDGKPGVLLEVRGKLRTHSGEVRYVVHLGA